ncbi:hypothetical protein BVRB_3g055380 [Beta vulgaris subsp. vulgaris]|uniref:uncharacterized protein LOC104888554 n=1 Tax=Beta vulgaris subsp. vulgaris TaxID=3555 RepID=UPI00053F5440|nr:uncharacterized protein LOC104888554 [Beta vulgaris subsp. vulgaris]KMT16393.1 hypothetical protein BVRB_3g055380 [Beta vulgaris subsp. vulgaris]
MILIWCRVIVVAKNVLEMTLKATMNLNTKIGIFSVLYVDASSDGTLNLHTIKKSTRKNPMERRERREARERREEIYVINKFIFFVAIKELKESLHEILAEGNKVNLEQKMSEETSHASRYVKLTKAHFSADEEIRPGELNQAIPTSQNSPCDPCLVHCCMHWCAICQEHREMKACLTDDFPMPMTVVNPPPVQEMNSGRENQEASATSTSEKNDDRNGVSLEMQAR